MNKVRAELSERSDEVLIEGYASVFGQEDACGDIVRPGAFANRLDANALPMLLQHRAKARVGRWVRVAEDGYGLFVRGLINGATALSLVKLGLSGLSIGFRPQVWTSRQRIGRVLSKIDLVEVSLVADTRQRASSWI